MARSDNDRADRRRESVAVALMVSGALGVPAWLLDPVAAVVLFCASVFAVGVALAVG